MWRMFDEPHFSSEIGQMEEKLLGTRDNLITDKSLMMSHLHFSIWAWPKIDHCPDFVEMSHVKWIAVRQSLTVSKAYVSLLQMSHLYVNHNPSYD